MLKFSQNNYGTEENIFINRSINRLRKSKYIYKFWYENLKNSAHKEESISASWTDVESLSTATFYTNLFFFKAGLKSLSALPMCHPKSVKT